MLGLILEQPVHALEELDVLGVAPEQLLLDEVPRLEPRKKHFTALKGEIPSPLAPRNDEEKGAPAAGAVSGP